MESWSVDEPSQQENRDGFAVFLRRLDRKLIDLHGIRTTHLKTSPGHGKGAIK